MNLGITQRRKTGTKKILGKKHSQSCMLETMQSPKRHAFSNKGGVVSNQN